MHLRKTIRILLINSQHQLLLMRGVDPTTKAVGKDPHPAFWCTIGGKIEDGESIDQACLRELFEETGYVAEDVKLGPNVWRGQHELILSGKHVELDESFIVVHLITDKPTNRDNFTENEKNIVTHLEWLSLDEILNHKEPIFPMILKTHLAAILNNDYPAEPLWVDLAKLPD